MSSEAVFPVPDVTPFCPAIGDDRHRTERTECTDCSLFTPSLTIRIYIPHSLNNGNRPGSRSILGFISMKVTSRASKTSMNSKTSVLSHKYVTNNQVSAQQTFSNSNPQESVPSTSIPQPRTLTLSGSPSNDKTQSLQNQRSK